jgi:hypothetical protein
LFLLLFFRYTAALVQVPDDAALLSNRSAARLREGDAAGALNDADACIAVRPDWVKG